MAAKRIWALILARGGSKRVPGKNIINVANHPLIGYSIVAAKLSETIDRIIVSTDSKEIAEIAMYYGAEVPFMRPLSLAHDDATDLDAVIHALDWFKVNEANEPEFLVHLRPTTPLRDPAIIDKAVRSIIDDDSATALRSAHRLHEPAQKMFGIGEDGYFQGLFPQDSRPEYYNLPGQHFPPTYLPNGYVDVLRTSQIRSSGTIHGTNVIPFVTDKSIEVDWPEDFKALEDEVALRGHLLLDYLTRQASRNEVPANSNQPLVETKFRRIVGGIPTQSASTIQFSLDQTETRSMHGQLPIVWDHAKDYSVYDSTGNRWIDFTSGIFVANVGHANERIISALKEALDQELLHSYNYPTEIRAKYLDTLISATPNSLEKAYLTSSGTEATEAALKIMRLYGISRGKRMSSIVSFAGSFHGRTLGAAKMGGIAQNRKWTGYENTEFLQMPFPYPWGSSSNKNGKERFDSDLANLEQRGIDPTKDIAGFLLETYIGWGALFFPKDYVEALAEFARKYDVLVAFDEIQSGFGRTGRFFGYEHYGVEADLVCCGKGMSGSIPLSGLLGRSHLMDLPDAGSMSSTHSGNPLACAAGLAVLQEIECRNLLSDVVRKEQIFFEALNRIRDCFPRLISGVYGKGLVAALIFVDPDSGMPNLKTASHVCQISVSNGVLPVCTGRESIKFGPPLTIPDDALEEGLFVIGEAVEEAVNSYRNFG